MKGAPIPHIEQLEAVLASHVVDLATEIRGYGAADLIAFIWLDRSQSLRDVLDSGCEALFQPSTMRFGGDAEVVVSWSAPPTIRIPMEFRSGGLEIYFRLLMKASSAEVEIDFLRCDDPDELTRLTIERVDRLLSGSRTFGMRRLPRHQSRTRKSP